LLSEKTIPPFDDSFIICFSISIRFLLVLPCAFHARDLPLNNDQLADLFPVHSLLGGVFRFDPILLSWLRGFVSQGYSSATFPFSNLVPPFSSYKWTEGRFVTGFISIRGYAPHSSFLKDPPRSVCPPYCYFSTYSRPFFRKRIKSPRF